MRTPLRIAAWLNLLPGALVCLVAPGSLFEWLGVGLDGPAQFLLRYLGVAYLVLFLVNAVAATRPSVWRPVIALDLLLYGASALVPVSWFLQSLAVSWFWWANAALDGAMFVLVAVAAIRTFWTR